MDAAGFRDRTGIDDATLARLEVLAAELARWNPAINLVAPRTLATVWARHILDSWQLAEAAGDRGGPWLDLGSGGGFPGLVVAACQPAPVTLIESDRRKSVFLRETARRMGVDVTVIAERIEAVTPFAACTISARALAPLPKLLGLCAPFCASDTVLLLPKGQDVDVELTEAAKYWKFELVRRPSLSDPRATLLRIERLHRHA